MPGRERPLARRRAPLEGAASVLVGLPLLGSVPTPTVLRWWQLGIPYERVIPVQGHYVQMAHNEIVRQALLRRDWSWLLFLEHDHPDLPLGLLERVAAYADEVDVAGAMYWLRRPPHHCCALVPREEHDTTETWGGEWDHGRVTYLPPTRELQALREGRLYRVLAVGMGCTAVHRRVLEAWPQGEPPFQTPHYRGATEIHTDDVWFCRRAAQLGFRVWLDAGLVLGHLGERLITVHDHMAELERQAREQGLLPDV